MKLRLALACAISVAALQPATAAAPAPETVRVVLAAYGTCIVKREGELARQLVLDPRLGLGQFGRSRRSSSTPESASTCESMYPRLPAARMK